MKKSHIAAIAVLVVNVALLIALGAVWLSYASLSDKLESQQVAERFGAGEKGFAQLSAYFPADNGITYNQVVTMRTAVEKYLEKQSVETLAEDAPLYLDGFSYRASELSITGVKGNTTANVIAIGGDFFSFHPYRLLSGSYIKESDIQHDRIVIDERTAWFLFGSSNVSGMYVTINGDSYKIAGVVEIESDSVSKEAYDLTFDNRYPLIFVPYEIFDDTGTVVQFTTYEFVTQSLFTTFVRDIFSSTDVKSTASALAQAELKINTNRFSIFNIYDVLTNFSARSVRANTIVYPYWENASRIAENKLAVKLIFLFILVLVPVLSLIYLFGWLLYHTKGKGKVIVEFVSDRMDFFNRLKWARKQKIANKKESRA